MSVLNQIQTRPEIIDRRLSEGCAVCCEFNRWGSLLAVGCHDGKVIIWDFDVLGVARVLVGHVRPITSVQWSHNGTTLLTSSADWCVCVWDVLKGEMKKRFLFDSPVLSASLHPGGEYALVSPFMEYAKLLNLETGEKIDIPVIPKEAKKKKGRGEEEEERKEEGGGERCVVNVIASTFDPTGDLIYTGNGNGIIAIFDWERRKGEGEGEGARVKLKKAMKVRGGGAIKSIWFSPSGKYYLVNCDKSLKLMIAETGEYVREFMDPILHPNWKSACFSNDEEYIVGGSAMKPLHNLYVWLKGGYLETTLEGPAEGVLWLRWHPRRTVIASCSSAGAVYIWTVKQAENWSAFAPEFKELEENQPYIEREDEFDVEEEGEGGNKAEEDLNEPLSEEEEEEEGGERGELRYLPPSVSPAVQRMGGAE